MSAIEQPVLADGGVPDSVPDQAAGAEIVQPSPAPAANESRRETIERNFKEVSAKPRDERGKFTPHVPRETLPAGESAATPAIAAQERPAMPKSYKKELESHWGTIPQEFAAAVAQREADYEKGVAPLKERARVADEFLNAIKPYERIIRGEGKTPIGAFQEYLNTAQVLRDPAQRVPAIASLMQQFGISIEHLQQALAGQPAPQPQGIDPSQIHQLVEQKFSDYQAQQAEQQNEREIEIFAANPEYAHFAAVQDWMGPILSSDKFRAEHQGESVQAKLKAAYTLALRMDPSLAPPVAAITTAPAPNPQQVAQARKAAVLVKGSPPSGAATKIDPKDRRALIEHNLRMANR